MASLTSLSESRRRKSLRLPMYFDDSLCQHVVQRCVTLVTLRQASYHGHHLNLLIFTLENEATQPSICLFCRIDVVHLCHKMTWSEAFIVAVIAHTLSYHRHMPPTFTL